MTYRDASARRGLAALADLSAILDHCREGYCYDRTDRCLYVTYQDTSGDAGVTIEIGP